MPMEYEGKIVAFCIYSKYLPHKILIHVEFKPEISRLKYNSFPDE